MRSYASPRLYRQRVMRRIVRLCSTAPRSNDELAKKIGTTRESVQVLTHRMRRYGQIETLNPGTHRARHVASEKFSSRAPTQPCAGRSPK